MSPHEANTGYKPEGMTPYEPNNDVPSANKWAGNLKKLHQELHKELTFIQQRMAAYANKKRSEGPTLKEGDKVYLLRRNIKTKRPSDKLDWKKLGPFKINKQISSVNYQLSLPQGMRIHPVFHVSLLEPAPKNAKLDRTTETTNEEYEVEKILDHRQGQQETEYLIKWKDYDHTENTWEPSSHLTGCQEELEVYRRHQIEPAFEDSRARGTPRPTPRQE